MGESGPSIVLSIRGYLTPTVLFLLLNVVILTIVLTSRNVRRHHHQENEPNHHQPTPLERVRSIGLFRFGSRDLLPEHSDRLPHHHQDPHPTALERVKSIGLFRFGSHDLPPPESVPEPAGHHDDMDHHFRRIQSESAASRPKPALAAEGGSKLRKLASALSWRASEAVTVRRRPVARREEVAADGEVDARADDFINRFKQQLRLQRLNSIAKITGSGSGSGGRK